MKNKDVFSACETLLGRSCLMFWYQATYNVSQPKWLRQSLDSISADEVLEGGASHFDGWENQIC